MMAKTTYVPIIKTTDAEIKGYSFLAKTIKEKILPVFELTRSRPLKNFPVGDIHRRMEQIGDITEGTTFILDLCSHADLINNQIEDLYDDSNGFQEWRKFLESYKNLNIIPALHLYQDNLKSYILLATHFSTRYEKVAFRASIDEIDAPNLQNIIEPIKNIVNLENQYHLILDAGYINEENFNKKWHSLVSLANTAINLGVRSISINPSSFPKSPRDRGGDDDEGEFRILEVDFFKATKTNIKNTDVTLHYGDYASIHPLRYSIKGGNWVPRIDLSLDESYIYKRLRRDDGGYADAAIEMINWNKYDPVECWGKEKIEEAATGTPEGRSPSFWIAVRLNQHVTRFSSLQKKLTR